MKICGQSPLAKALRRRWWIRRHAVEYPRLRPGWRVRFTHYYDLWGVHVEEQDDKDGKWCKVAFRTTNFFTAWHDRTTDELCRWLNKL